VLTVLYSLSLSLSLSLFLSVTQQRDKPTNVKGRPITEQESSEGEWRCSFATVLFSLLLAGGYATNREVAGSIPDGVTGIFQ